MEKGQEEALRGITGLHERVMDDTIRYWVRYSGPDTWQFWALAALIVVPLVALFLLMDRRKALLLGFYGFNVHAWFHYVDLFFVTRGWVVYPYKFLPFLPSSVSLDTSLVPVSYMLLYQWTLNRKKNYYVYAAGLSFFLAFLLKPALTSFGLFRLQHGANYFHLFLGYIVIALVAKLITAFFLYLLDRPNRRDRRKPESAPLLSHRVPFVRRKAR